MSKLLPPPPPIRYALKGPDGALVPGSYGSNPAHVLYNCGCFPAVFERKDVKSGHGIRYMLHARRKGYRVVRVNIVEAA